MSNRLQGMYVITDEQLTPNNTVIDQVESALKGGATIVQLRDKKSDLSVVRQTAIKLQELCFIHDALFVLNDYVELAIELGVDGLHIGKSDHNRFEEIRKDFKGIIGVSCYGDVYKAKNFEAMGADYVAFGSFFKSPTKPDSNIVSLRVISDAKEQLSIPVCVIGGINIHNADVIYKYKPDMVSIVSDAWKDSDIENKIKKYVNKFEGEEL